MIRRMPKLLPLALAGLFLVAGCAEQLSPTASSGASSSPSTATLAATATVPTGLTAAPDAEVAQYAIDYVTAHGMVLDGPPIVRHVTRSTLTQARTETEGYQVTPGALDPLLAVVVLQGDFKPQSLFPVPTSNDTRQVIHFLVLGFDDQGNRIYGVESANGEGLGPIAGDTTLPPRPELPPPPPGTPPAVPPVPPPLPTTVTSTTTAMP